MKKFLPVLFLIAAASAYATDYDLAAYLAAVERNNPDLLLAAKELEAARISVAQARSSFFPSIGVQGGYTRNLTDQMTSTPVASLPGGGPLVYQDVDTNFDNEVSAAIGVQQTLFDASSIANYKKARIGASIREAALRHTRASLRAAAKKLYAQTQLILHVAAIAESTEKTSEEIYRSVERKFRAGSATELDSLMAEVDWKQKSAAAAETRKNAQTVLVAFRNLADIPHDEEVTLTETHDALPAIPADDGRGLSAAFDARSDYRATLLSGELADQTRKAAAGAFLPTAKAQFSYALGGMGNDSLTGDYDYNAASLGISVTVPLFTGGYRLALLKAAKVEQEKARLSIIKKQNEIESELLECRLRFDDAYARTQTALAIVEMAGRALELAQRSYNNGLATQLSVTEAADRSAQARLGLESAIYDCFAAYYDWELAAGK
jgi:outer membrane protein TolC